jgi:HEAT repeats
MRLVGALPRIATIEFFGHKGVDIAAIRAALPFHEGDELAGGEEAKARVREAVVRAIGSEPTDVAAICCRQDGGVLLFIGLRGGSFKAFAYGPTPTGEARVSADLEELDKRLDEAIGAAVQKGGDAAREDDSQGYALSHDPEARSIQLALRRYAIAHEPELFHVLESSRDAKLRAIASQALGYAHQSARQVLALTRAARDPDDEVRNNATRALGVLAGANHRRARQILPDVFIEMLSSGVWTDRNKGAMVLEALTARRPAAVLDKLRAAALDSLIEMALWHEASHAYFARMVLGRVAGIPEKRLQELAGDGPPEAIVAALSGKPGGL